MLPAGTPARFGCYLGLLCATVLAGYGLYMFFDGSDMPLPFRLSLLVGGVLQTILCLKTLHRSRAGWAFALSLNGTLGVVFLFGAPKLRDAFDMSLIAGLVPAVAFGVVTMLLATATEDFG
jgi:hypothetical protein